MRMRVPARNVLVWTPSAPADGAHAAGHELITKAIGAHAAVLAANRSSDGDIWRRPAASRDYADGEIRGRAHPQPRPSAAAPIRARAEAALAARGPRTRPGSFGVDAAFML